jgi:hypothetical protein
LEQKLSGLDPCRLVTQSQAAKILQTQLLAPQEAPLGPTCVYRATRQAVVVAVSVTSKPISQVSKQSGLTESSAQGRTMYCTSHGSPTLYAGIGASTVLTITGACPVAQQFAIAALKALQGG